MKPAINNLIKKVLAARSSTVDLYTPIFGLVPKVAPYIESRLLGPLLRRMIMIEPDEARFTQGYFLNLNEDITDNAQSVVLPIEMIKQVIKDSPYRMAMDRCLCRVAHDCKDYRLHLHRRRRPGGGRERHLPGTHPGRGPGIC